MFPFLLLFYLFFILFITLKFGLCKKSNNICSEDLYTAMLSRVHWKNTVWGRVNKRKLPVGGKNIIRKPHSQWKTSASGGVINGKFLSVDGFSNWNFPLLLKNCSIEHGLTQARSNKHFPCQEDFGPCTSWLWSGIWPWDFLQCRGDDSCPKLE
jgi:hypothetical protein